MSDITIEAFENIVRRVVNEALENHKATASPWFTPEQAAEYLGCTVGTLKTWRSTGAGPRFSNVQGRAVRYHIDDLDAFYRERG